MKEQLKLYIQEIVGDNITSAQAVSGGDISTAYKISTRSNHYFLKLNDSDSALDMFQKEAAGLNLIASTQTIATPKVLGVDKIGSTSFLILDFVESKPGTSSEMELFGEHLAKLHNVSSDAFGLITDNYIGSLSQSNMQHDAWIDFYVQERLSPQFKTATAKGRLTASEIPSNEVMFTSLKECLAGVKPSLLHGDLWSGNYLISTNGQPYLIDPAVYFGHSEVDIAMSELFGGFSKSFYESYFRELPRNRFTSDRIQIYQLYYLLVHLNLFGTSYRSSVIEFVKKFF